MRVMQRRMRCNQCGARNDDVDLCRICGYVLPARRDPDALNFEALIDQELASWRVIAEHPVMGD